MTTINQRVVAYAACCMGFCTISTAFSFYYVKVFLNIFHIEEGWFHISQVLFMIWNAVNDPLFAYLQDSTNLSFTKTRRESVLYGGPLFAFSFLIPWFSWGGGAMTTGLHLIIALCVWDTMFTFVGLAQCCLFAEISKVEEHRLKLLRYSQVGSLIGSSSVLVLEFMSSSLENYTYFQITCAALAVFSCLLFRYAGKHCHTEYDLSVMKNANCEQNEVKHEKEVHTSYWRLTWQILTMRDFLSFVFMNFLQEFHRTFLSNFMAIICDQLIATDVVSPWIRSTFYGSLSMTSQVLVIFGVPVIGKVGYFRVIRANFVWKIFSGIVMFCIGMNHPWILMLHLLLDSCFTNGAFSIFNMPLSDVADEDMRIYGRKHPISSMVFGTNALVVKPSHSLAPMFVVALLNSYGYHNLKKNVLLPEELDSLKYAMFSLVCFFPLVLGVLQLLIWSFYTIREKRTFEDTFPVASCKC